MVIGIRLLLISIIYYIVFLTTVCSIRYEMKSLYLLLLFHFQFQTSKSNKIKLKASRQSGFDNTFQISDAIGIYERLSIIQCLEQCHMNTRCLSFFFNENKQKCILHSTTFWDESPSSSGKGWRLYYTVDGK